MNIALLLSGGTGTRLGSGIPKQYIEVGGKPIIVYAIEQLSRHKEIDVIQIVAEKSWQGQIMRWLKNFNCIHKFKGFSDPGSNRQLSILHGLEDIYKYAACSNYVFIHDAARPLLSGMLISQCIAVAADHDGAMPVLPMKDTVYLSANGTRVSSLLDRSKVFLGQAPEVFVLGKYLEANRKLLPDKILKVNGSTEPAIMAGMDIAMIPGDENNFKITTQADLLRFKKYIEEKSERGEAKR